MTEDAGRNEKIAEASPPGPPPQVPITELPLEGLQVKDALVILQIITNHIPHLRPAELMPVAVVRRKVIEALTERGIKDPDAPVERRS